MSRCVGAGAELVGGVFDGAGYPRYPDWEAALRDWRSARRKWATDHGVNEADMPADTGPSPFDALIGPGGPTDA